MSTYITESSDMEGPLPVSAAPAGSQADPGPADLDARIISAWADGATSDAVALLLPEVQAAAIAAGATAQEEQAHALDPRIPREEVTVARRAADDATFVANRFGEAARRLADRLTELKAAESAAVLRAEHEALSRERDRLVGELVGMANSLAQIGRLALAIDACDRSIKRWNPLGGRTHGYVRPVLSADLPPTLAGLFADARVMDSFIGMAMSPPLPSSPSPKLRAV